MDKNKLQVLKDIKYEVKDTCETCTHSSFSSASQNRFGTCARYTYKHAKHDGDYFLSIVKNGWCDKYERNRLAAFQLEGFAEFQK